LVIDVEEECKRGDVERITDKVDQLKKALAKNNR